MHDTAKYFFVCRNKEMLGDRSTIPGKSMIIYKKSSRIKYNVYVFLLTFERANVTIKLIFSLLKRYANFGKCCSCLIYCGKQKKVGKQGDKPAAKAVKCNLKKCCKKFAVDGQILWQKSFAWQRSATKGDFYKCYPVYGRFMVNIDTVVNGGV